MLTVFLLHWEKHFSHNTVCILCFDKHVLFEENRCQVTFALFTIQTVSKLLYSDNMKIIQQSLFLEENCSSVHLKGILHFLWK